MNILVTGAAGYLGSVLVGRLLADGHVVHALDCMRYGGRGVAPYIGDPHITVDDRNIVACIDRPKAHLSTWFRGLRNIDGIIHLAAIVGEAACNLDRDEARRVNVDGTKAALDLGRPTVVVSTCSNYGVTGADVEVDESFPLAPQSFYAETKVEAEQLAMQAGATVLRLGTLHGASPRMRFDLLVNELGMLAAIAGIARVYAPDSWRPYTHVRDAVDAIVAVLCQPIRPAVWNVASENVVKRDLLKFCKVAVEMSDAGPDRRDYRVSSDRFRAAFPRWRPTRTVTRGMKEARAIAQYVPDPQSPEFRNA